MYLRLVALVAALSVTLLTVGAAAEPIHVQSPSRLVSEGGSDLKLPPGYFLPEPEWENVDEGVKTLQTRVTQIEAENKVLRAAPTWTTVIMVGVLGLATGTYITLKVF